MVLFGDDEIKSGVVKVKDMGAKTEDVVPVSELVATLGDRIKAWREQQKQQQSQKQQ
jgi:histidyl-tRNA synthetase